MYVHALALRILRYIPARTYDNTCAKHLVSHHGHAQPAHSLEAPVLEQRAAEKIAQKRPEMSCC